MVATENGSSQEGPLREAIAMASGFRAQASRTRANYGEQTKGVDPGAVRWLHVMCVCAERETEDAGEVGHAAF